MILEQMKSLPLFCTRLLTAFLAMLFLVMSLCVIAPELVVRSATTEEELNQQLEEIEKELEKSRAELADAKKKVQAAKQIQEDLGRQIDIISKKIDIVEQRITEREKEIEETQNDIVKKEEEIALQELAVQEEWADFKQRVSSMQDMNDTGFFELLEASNSLYDFLTLPEIIADIYRYSVKSMDKMREEQERLAAQRQSLDERKNFLEESRRALDAEKSAMSAEKARLTDKLAEAEYAKSSAERYEKIAESKVDTKTQEYTSLKSQIKKAIAENPDRTVSSFICPLNSYSKISSPFGTRNDPFDNTQREKHKGIDMAAAEGTPVYSVADGKVLESRYSETYGNTILIYHGSLNGQEAYSSRYAHLRSRSVQEGSNVKQGQKIGEVGNTGRSTGPHLHLELWRGETLINPRSVISIPNKR